ncbi:alpha/beta hydrolase-fold protein [Mycolicibacterium komossense]|uniref:alpha/beta hydrolase-fold protein n=1 Tax=Mycolicibacterium komossense TaxID=1779 RepID=UPI003F49A26D
MRHRVAGVSLMHGWLPPTVQAAAVVSLGCAVAGRSGRWWIRRLPLTLGFGAALAMALHWYLGSTGLSGGPAPNALWLWLILAGTAAGVILVGFRGTQWWRRASALAGVPLCLLSAALVLNAWVGYTPTVYSAWNQLTAGPLPDQTDVATVTAMQRAHVIPVNGTVVQVTISGVASKFPHRGELVYLPPAWFASTPPPPLPVVMMIGAEFNTPADWLRIGGATSAADAFAAAHGGNAPVLVFVDSGGAFGVDTECVNGARGNAADHLTKDVVPFMISNFGASSDPARWGVAGFSTGGTCALDLTVIHPDLFRSFVDIAGDAGPNAGTKEQTVARLFGGDAAAWAAFDPATVIAKHGPYRGVSGWFAIAPSANHGANAGGQDVAARTLCNLAAGQGIDCGIVTQRGNHDWVFAAAAFAAALPWLAGQLGTSGAPHIAFPASPAQVGSTSTTEAAGR